jgi:multicomponent Na+:H+ antiporter subunit E
MSGHYTLLMTGLGVLSIALVVYVSHAMGVVDQESQPLQLSHALPGYWLWLLKEIVLANFDVTWRIWRGKSAINPTRLTLDASQKTDIGRVIFANSITLTPGTVAIELIGNKVTVHSLSQRASSGLAIMNRQVTRMEP